MATAPQFPGVFVEEVPSGVRTIDGVPTSITAFVGRALRGPMDDDPQGRSPVRVRSWAEYERSFGGLWAEAPMAQAVQLFFLNGGTEALVVRVGAGTLATASRRFGCLTLRASSPGRWGGALQVSIDHGDGQGGTLAAPLFNLQLHDTATGQREVFAGVSPLARHPRSVVKLLLDSTLARASVSGRRTQPGPVVAAALTVANTADGTPVTSAEVLTGATLAATQRGLNALARADIVNLLVIPPYAPGADVAAADLAPALAWCRERGALLLVDPPAAATSVAAALAHAQAVGRDANAAFYFPRLRVADPWGGAAVQDVAPGGAVAGVIARTDASRGVWAAPAGNGATLQGVLGLSVALSQAQMAQLNPRAVNCLQNVPGRGLLVWGARTLAGDDGNASDWKYVPVRRLALFITQSVQRGTRWTVFEPNGEPLWAQLRLNVGAFLNGLFRQGAFQGNSPSDAYVVRCGASTTTATELQRGLLTLELGFAPLQPAEFVLLRLQLQTAQATP